MAQNRLVFLRTVVLATILLGLIAYVVIRSQMPSSDPAAPLAAVGSGYTAKPLEEPPDLSDPAKLRRPRMYLVPDRRFTGALERIHAFYTGEPATVTTTYRDDGWDVTVGEDIAFRWPEPVDFGDYLAAATTVMDALDATHPVALAPGSVDDETQATFDKRLGAGHQVPMIDIVIEADALWAEGKRDPRLLIYAAEVAGRLMFEGDDTLQMSDDLDSYALYLTALERHFRPYKGTDRREIRLAEEFGYDNYAKSRAGELDETDPVRALVTQDFGPTARPVPYAGASPYERFMYEWWRMARIGGASATVFGRALDRRPFDQAVIAKLTNLNWWGTVQEVPPMQASLTGLALTALLNDDAELGAAYREMLVKESADPAVYEAHHRRMDSVMKRYADPFDWRLWQLVQRFESQQPAGPLADYEAFARVYRSYLVTSIYRVGKHMMDTYSSVQAVAEYLEAVPKAVDSEVSAYRRWYEAKALDKRAAPDAQKAAEATLKDRRGLGHFLFLELYETYANYDYEFPLQRRQRAMFEHVHEHSDGRPQFRYAFSVYADNYMFDRFRKVEELEALAKLAAADFESSMLWYEVAVRDVDRIKERASQPDLTGEKRIELARYIAEIEGWEEERLAAHLVELARSGFDESACVNEAIDILHRTGEYRQIVELGREWFPKLHRSGTVAAANFRARIAAAHYELGEYAEAWEIVEPIIPVYNESSLLWGSRVLEALGESERALELAKASVERYSDSLFSRMRLAEWYWNHDDFAAAAEVLTAPGFRVETHNWHRTFTLPVKRVFADRPREDLRAACRALLDAGFESKTLARVGVRLAQDGQPELALPIYLEVQPVSDIEMWVVPDIYLFMEAEDGMLEARKWWASVPTRAQHRNGSVYFHTNGLHEYLWELYPPDYGQEDPLHLVLQVVACAMEPALDAKHGAALREFLAGTGNRWSYIMCRYLLGEEEESVLLNELKHPKKLSEAAYFFGIIAEHEGRIVDAWQWYLVSTDGGFVESGPVSWATSRLRDLKKQTATPQVAEAEWRRERQLAGD